MKRPKQMTLECIAAGAYYWFRAEGEDENMVSALNRMKYREMVQRFDTLNIPRPTPEEIYAYAAEKWPKHKLHPAPKAAYYHPAPKTKASKRRAKRQPAN